MISTLTTALAALSIAPAQDLAAKVERDASASTVTYTIQNTGRIFVYLPSDLAAGDTITGTVIAVPDGRTDAERKKNSDVLEGYVIELPSGRQPAKTSQPSFTVPTAIEGGALALSLFAPGGKPAGSAQLPVEPPIPCPWTGIDIPRVGTAGRPIEINGPFDGRLGNTSASYDGRPLTVLAESPRGCVVMPPPNQIGPGQIQCSEGTLTATGPYNNLRLQMTADKTTLLAGERTNVGINVTGMDGLKPDEFPIPLEVTYAPEGRIQVEGFQGTRRCFAIQASNVVNGAWNMNLVATGVQTGPFLLRGVLFAVGVHAIKKNLNRAEFVALINAIIAQHQAEIDKINAEEKAAKDKGEKWPNSPGQTGSRMKRDLLKTTIEKLRLAKDLADTDLGAAKVVADKAIADLSVVQLGADLISFAAEMLGYTDIPLPGVGAALKGAKVLTKSKKIIELIEAAEKALEVYEKAKDAADKAEKLKELKEKVDKVKEALEAEK